MLEKMSEMIAEQLNCDAETITDVYKRQVRIPRGHDALEIGDRVVIVTTNRGLRDINDILAK